MSIVINCDASHFGLDDIYRLVTATDVDGNWYIRVYGDGVDPDDLNDLVDCNSGDITMLDILRGALVIVDGEYALNVADLS